MARVKESKNKREVEIYSSKEFNISYVITE
jgi:hypothetical protein